jgi:hypothetical protein
VSLTATAGSPTAWVSAFTPGVGFSITANAADAQSYDYLIN